MNDHRQIDLRSAALVAAYLGIIGVVAYGALMMWQTLSFVLLPFAVAVLLTALLEPVARFMKHTLRLPAAIAALITVLGTITLVAGVFVGLAPQVAAESSTIADQVQQGIIELPSLLNDLGIKDADIQDAVTRGTEKLKEDFGSIAGHLGSGVVSVASVVTSIVGGILLVLMMLIYLLMDGGGFWRGFTRFVPADRRRGWEEGAERAWDTLKLFIRSQVLVSAIDGIGVGVGLWIVGVPLALPLGVLTFVLSLIPTIGAIIAGILSALVALASNGLSGFLWAIAIAVIVQQLEGNVLYPLLVGKSLGLHPLAVLLAVGAGTAVLGIVGSFLATPLMAAVAAGMGWLGPAEEPAAEAGQEAAAQATAAGGPPGPG